MKMNMLRTLVLAILLATFGLTAQAQTCDDFSRSLAFTPTLAGQQMEAVGAVKASGDTDCYQMIGAVVSAKVQDGAILTVSVVTAKGAYKIAGMPMFLGTGQILLDNVKNVSDAFPLENVQKVQILYQANRAKGSLPVVLLEASF